MKGIYINKLLATSIVSLVAANFLNANEFTQDVVESAESAFGETKGFIAKKSATGSKMDADITEIPQSISIITKDFISTINADSIHNVTAYNASVNQPYGESGDKRTNYGKIRGLGNLYESSFLDGLRLLRGSFLAPNIDPYSLEKVEVLKGPSSVLYGASGPGGLLNQQSKKANFTDEKELGFSYGTNNTYSVFTDLNLKASEDVALRLTGKYKQGDNELEKSDHSSYFFNPTLTYNVNDTTSIDIFTSFAKNEIKGLGLRFAGVPSTFKLYDAMLGNVNANVQALQLAGRFPVNPLTGSGPNPFAAAVPGVLTPNGATVANLEAAVQQFNNLNLPSDLNIGLPEHDIFNKKHQMVGASFKKHFSDNLKYTNNFRFKKMDGINDYTFPDLQSVLGSVLLGSVTGSGLTKLPLSLTRLDSELKTFTLDNNFEYKWENDNIANTTLVGADIQYTDFHRIRRDPAKYVFDLEKPYANINIVKPNTIDQDLYNEVTQIGVYASNMMKINDKLVINTALRYDKISEKSQNKATNIPKSKQKNNNVSTRVGLTYLMDNGLAPYLSYTTSFEVNIGSDVNGNKFKPSKGKQYEVGLKYVPNNFDGLITLSAFDLTKEDFIQDDPSNPNESIQQGDAEVKGIEFEAIASPTKNSKIVLSMAKLDSKETNTNPLYEGKDLDDVVDFKASIWGQYTFEKTAVGDLTLGAGVKYIGNQKTVSADYARLDSYVQTQSFPSVRYDVDSYVLTDAMISTKYKDLNIALNVKNVFDKIEPIANNPLSTEYTQGRTFNLTAKYKF